MYRGWIRSVAMAMAVFVSVPTWSSAQDRDQIAALAAKVKALGRFGKGNREASAAVAQLSKLSPSTITIVLQEMRGCTPLSANCFRAAVVSSSQSDPEALP